MYAVIETGGKQYRVSPGDIVEVELLGLPAGEAGAEKHVTFDKVLLVSDNDKFEVGTPYLKGIKVPAKVIGETRAPKVTTFKYKNKINYHRTIGHKQPLTQIQIEEIKYGA